MICLFTSIYDVLLALSAVFWLFFKRLKKRNAQPGLKERLGFNLPETNGKRVIWLHAVSVGETKAARPLFLLLKKSYPDAFFFVTTTTFTGQQEAKRSLSSADAFAFLPLDLSWIMQRWAKKLNPTHFVLIEGDFWWNLLRILKKRKTKLILASGKISKKSASRFKKVPFFAKHLFGFFDLFCVQNQEMASLFSSFRKDLHIAGNLKYDLEPLIVSTQLLEKFQRPFLTLSCTHGSEENLLLDALNNFLKSFSIFLAPRHPERFDEVEKLLQQKKLSYVRWSQIEKATGEETIILMDCIGKLAICYTKSLFAFVAGSFVDHIGGHNVLEPCLYGCPSFFGPYTYSQKELTTLILREKAGLQIPLERIEATIQHLLQNPSSLEDMRESAKRASQINRGAAKKTFSLGQEKRIWQ